MTAPAVWHQGDELWFGHDCGERGWTSRRLFRHTYVYLNGSGETVTPEISCPECGFRGQRIGGVWWQTTRG